MATLEPEQKSLFVKLVDAVRSVPRNQRQEFMLIRTFGGDHLQGNDVDLEVLHEDLVALEDAGLIRVTQHHRKGSGFNFVVPPNALAQYDELKSGAERDDEMTSETADSSEPVPGMSKGVSGDDVNRRAVMVVHGRNELARRAMFNFLRALGLEPLEWGKLVAGTKKGAPYVGEVLEHAFRAAAAVVVLFTPDDEARLRESFRTVSSPSHETELTPQARPNVLFEAGMALGVHPDRTILVELGQLRPFSDIYGRHVVRLDGTEAPLRDIARRLEQAGCEVDTSGDDWGDPAQFPEAEIQTASRSPSASMAESTVAREVEYLNEDARRWLEDRDRVLLAEEKQRSGEMNSRGLLYSGAHLAGLAALRRQALQEYRDETSRKRRRYRDLCDAAPDGVEVPRFSLEKGSLEILARWRSTVTIAGMDNTLEVDDPTDPSREPDLRRFEDEGDSPSDG